MCWACPCVLQAHKALRDILKLPQKQHYYPELNGFNLIVTSSSSSNGNNGYIEGPGFKLTALKQGSYTRDGTVPVIMPAEAARSELHAGGCRQCSCTAPFMFTSAELCNMGWKALSFRV
jgi:hypothetical protein